MATVGAVLTPAHRFKFPRVQPELLVVTDTEFVPELEPLLERRRSQGISVATVSFETVRDVFGDGFGEPEAIHRMLAEFQAQYGVPPRFLLLVGTATFDPLDYLDTGKRSWVPSALRSGGPANYEMASDDALIPEALKSLVAVGRVPAESEAKLSAWVEKTLSQETAQGSRARVLYDGSDVQLSKNIAETVANDGLSAWPGTELRALTGSVGMADALRGLEAAQILAYVGHGHPTGWGAHLSTDSLVELPEMRWTLGLHLDCYDGLFTNPYAESLASAMLVDLHRGPAAVYSPSTVLIPAQHHVLSQALLRHLTQPGTETLGERIRDAETELRAQGTGFADVAAAYNLFGDPSMPWQAPVADAPVADPPVAEGTPGATQPSDAGGESQPKTPAPGSPPAASAAASAATSPSSGWACSLRTRHHGKFDVAVCALLSLFMLRRRERGYRKGLRISSVRAASEDDVP